MAGTRSKKVSGVDEPETEKREEMKLFSSYFSADVSWFRVFGYGFAFSKYTLFSDRIRGRKKYFGYHIRPLKP